MIKLDEQSIKMLVEINKYLSMIEVKGHNNINLMFNCMNLLQNILQKIDNQLQEGITIDNTKGE